jgi:hypothetical protein
MASEPRAASRERRAASAGSQWQAIGHARCRRRARHHYDLPRIVRARLRGVIPARYTEQLR